MGVTTSKPNKEEQALPTFPEFEILIIESNLDFEIIVNELPNPQTTISAQNNKYPEDIPQIIKQQPILQKRAPKTKEPRQIVQQSQLTFKLLTHQAKIDQLYKHKHQSLSTLSPLKSILKVSKSHDPFGFSQSTACSPTSTSNYKQQISSERRKQKRYNLDEIF